MNIEAPIPAFLELVPELALSIPPAYVDDLRRLLVLEADGFIAPGRIRFDTGSSCYRLEIEAAEVTHILELLAVASNYREAETFTERAARLAGQLSLDLGGGR